MSLFPLGLISQGGGGAAANALTLISTTTSGGSSITFSSIPSTYKHLQIRWATITSNNFVNMRMIFNSDTGANYSYHYLAGDGSTLTSGNSTSRNDMITFGFKGGMSNTQTNSGIIDVLEYANTNIYKTIRSMGGVAVSPYEIGLYSGNYRSTSAVSSITFSLSAGTFGTTRFSLYGVS